MGFSGRLEHIPNDTKTPGVDATGVASATLKGTIKVFQAKLTIPVKGTGTKVPISFTAANRTELIKEKREIRANFGVTFDLDSIFAKAFAR